MVSGWVVCGVLFLAGAMLGRLVGRDDEREAAETAALEAAERRREFRSRVPLWRRGYLTAGGRLTTFAGAAFIHVPVSAAEVTRAIWAFRPPRSLPEHAEYIRRVAGHVQAQREIRERHRASLAATASMN